MINHNDVKITDGYIGSFGLTWDNMPTEDKFEKAIAGAMNMSNRTRDEVLDAIATGKGIKWQQSPNYYYDHSYGYIRLNAVAAVAPTVRCDCGHRVPRSQRMSASMGTSCPDCYDRMSN